MLEKIVEHVKGLLAEKKIDAFLGLRKEGEHIGPHLFTDPDDLGAMTLGGEGDTPVRYPLTQVLTRLFRAHPEKTIGVLVRGCDERALLELFKWNQLDPQRVVPVGIACTRPLAEACACGKPFPEALVAGEKVEGVARSALVAELDALPESGRFTWWMGQFERCVKCYGCRNICPVCFCKECSLEEPELVASNVLPAENPIFHLTRAVHMAGRCIDCGLCEEACPADIPLRTLYKKVGEILEDEFGYKTGEAGNKRSPLSMMGPAEKAS